MLKTQTKRQLRGRHNDQTGEQSGFTLVETSIAMVIMMIAALASVSLFAYSIKFNSGATDRELAMAVAQQQMEQLRSVSFTDTALTATTATSTVTSANRRYTVVKTITNSNVVDGAATMKTITIAVTPTYTTLGAVSLRTQRSTLVRGPY